MAAIGISYTAQQGAQTVYNIIIDKFLGNDLPRTYSGAVDFSTSANGTSILTGPAHRQKYIWAISALVSKEVALQIDAMYKDWDADRAKSLGAGCGLTDETFGDPITTAVVFSTAPSFNRLSPVSWEVNFGLTEV